MLLQVISATHHFMTALFATMHERVSKADLEQGGSGDGDKVLLAPAILAHAHGALLHAVLPHNSGKDLRTLLKCKQEGRMPAGMGMMHFPM